MLIKGFLLFVINFQLIFLAEANEEDSDCPRINVSYNWVSLTGRWQIKQTVYHLNVPENQSGEKSLEYCGYVDIVNDMYNSTEITWKQNPNIYYQGRTEEPREQNIWALTGPNKHLWYPKAWDHKSNTLHKGILNPMYVEDINVPLKGRLHAYILNSKNIMLNVCLRDENSKKKVKSFSQLLTREDYHYYSDWEEEGIVNFIDKDFYQKGKLKKLLTLKTNCKKTCIGSASKMTSSLFGLILFITLKKIVV